MLREWPLRLRDAARPRGPRGVGAPDPGPEHGRAERSHESPEVDMESITMSDQDLKTYFKEMLDGLKPLNLKDDFYLLLTTLVLTILWFIYVHMFGSPLSMYLASAAQRCPPPPVPTMLWDE